jgi:hypothetical protein
MCAAVAKNCWPHTDTTCNTVDLAVIEHMWYNHICYIHIHTGQWDTRRAVNPYIFRYVHLLHRACTSSTIQGAPYGTTQSTRRQRRLVCVIIIIVQLQNSCVGGHRPLRILASWYLTVRLTHSYTFRASPPLRLSRVTRHVSQRR